MKILVVDDESTARCALAKALRGAEREILEADDGETAISMVIEHSPDLVFLDLNMPKKDGLVVLLELARRQHFVMPEIIVVTANDSIHIAVECIRRGATDFLTKPYDVDHVRSIANRTEKRVRLERQDHVARSGFERDRCHQRRCAISGLLGPAVDGRARPNCRGFRKVINRKRSERRRRQYQRGCETAWRA